MLFYILFTYFLVFNHAYKPILVPCDNDLPLVRTAEETHPAENAYLRTKRSVRDANFRRLLESMAIPGLKVDTVEPPSIGLAFSGGGFRAMISGAGVMAALDSRVDEGASPLAGIFQSSKYIVGLSGGSWLLGSLYHNDMPTTVELRDSPHVWNLHAANRMAVSTVEDEQETVSEADTETVDTDALVSFLASDDASSNMMLFHKINGFLPLSYIRYYNEIHREVQSKADAGFPVSIVDYWGRGLALTFINDTRGGVNRSWSDIPSYRYWKDERVSYPIPIIVANVRKNYRTARSAFPTVIEFTPFEMGSWCKTLGAFVRLHHVGTKLHSGAARSPMCVKGFDNIGFIMGTSSAIFNDLFFLYPGIAAYNDTVSAYLHPGIDGQTEFIISELPSSNKFPLSQYRSYRPLSRERAFFRPNPFFNFNTTDLNANVTQASEIYLVDGGVDGQNLPLEPLLQPARNLDMVYAFDFSADTERNFPAGITLRHSARKFRNPMYNISFPYIPRFIRRDTAFKLTMFLGCYESDYRDHTLGGPLIVYVPNTSFSVASNIPTMQLMYSHERMSSLMQNGFNIATKGNSTLWSQCVGCASLLRQWQRTRTEPPTFCNACFRKYCYRRY